MNENHKRHLSTAFRHIDEVLAEVETVLSGSDPEWAFRRYAQDFKPIQRTVVLGYIARIRESMRRILDEQGVPIPPPVCGALWAVRSSLLLLRNMIEEFGPRHMRGYGELTHDAEGSLTDIRSELNALFTRLSDYLAQADGGDLQARLERLEQTTDEARLLRELDRIVASHGLVECQAAVVMLTERLENLAFEIGVFGRVSSGKSSLLNHLLGGEILPVGVTPVTALPARIAAGDTAEACVAFAEADSLTIPLTRLVEFCSEQQNPGNAKHVTRIDVRLPSSLLQEGVAFVDTPGLGSLAVAGAEETIAYLPRCDLGIVLVDAASAITREDIVVVNALCRAGAAAMVLLSKADLLSPSDRQQAANYANAQLREQMGPDLPVHAVSVRGADAALCKGWRQNILQPMLDTHKDGSARALRRKVGGLREAVVEALQQRKRMQEQPASVDTTSRHEDALRALREGDALLDEALRRIPDLAVAWSSLSGAILDAATHSIAAAWKQGMRDDTQPAALVSEVAGRELNKVCLRLKEQLDQLRSRASNLLNDAESAMGHSPSSAEEIIAPAGMPAPGLPGWRHDNKLIPPLLTRMNDTLLRRWIRGSLGDLLDPELGQAIRRYGTEVRKWFRQYVEALQKDYTARAELCRARMGAPPQEGRASKENIDEDLRILGQWASPS